MASGAVSTASTLETCDSSCPTLPIFENLGSVSGPMPSYLQVRVAVPVTFTPSIVIQYGVKVICVPASVQYSFGTLRQVR